MIFVDTSAWFALMDRSCVEHSMAKALAESVQEPFVTTDYVLAESLTLLRARRLHNEAIELGQLLLSERLARLEWVAPEDVQKAWVFFQYRDKEWSFVDCVSFAVIQRLNVQSAFALDDHFRRFGTLTVHPA